MVEYASGLSCARGFLDISRALPSFRTPSRLQKIGFRRLTSMFFLPDTRRSAVFRFGILEGKDGSTRRAVIVLTAYSAVVGTSWTISRVRYHSSDHLAGRSTGQYQQESRASKLCLGHFTSAVIQVI